MTPRTWLVALAMGGCTSGAPSAAVDAPGGQGVTELGGETIISTATPGGVHTTVYLRSGAPGFSTDLDYSGSPNFRWSTADGTQAGAFTMTGDLASISFDTVNTAAFSLFHWVQEAATGSVTYDTHGCTLPLVGTWLSCSNAGVCCDQHDACYHQNDCSSASWLGRESAECDACNQRIVACILGAAESFGRRGEPSRCCAAETCGQPWCFNDLRIEPCETGCCGDDGLCRKDQRDCPDATACRTGDVCLTGVCTDKLCGGPLAVTAGSAFDCAGPGMTLTASGGKPPYSFTSAPGTVTPTGARTAFLQAPPNPGADSTAPAFSTFDGTGATSECSGGHSTCNWGWACIGPPGTIHYWDCGGRALNDAQCGGVWECVGYGPTCPVDCGVFEQPKIDEACGVAGDARDVRTEELVAAGCNPCRIAMREGATVTVTDGNGATATALIGAP